MEEIYLQSCFKMFHTARQLWVHDFVFHVIVYCFLAFFSIFKFSIFICCFILFSFFSLPFFTYTTLFYYRSQWCLAEVGCSLFLNLTWVEFVFNLFLFQEALLQCYFWSLLGFPGFCNIYFSSRGHQRSKKAF